MKLEKLRIAGIVAVIGGGVLVAWSLWPELKARYLVYRMSRVPYDRVRLYQQKLEDMGKPAVGALRDELTHFDPMMRWVSARLLGKAGDPTAVDALVATLKDSDWTVRQRAAEALGTIGSKEALPDLIRALRDPVKQVRSYSATAIGKIGDPSTFAILASMVGDDDAHTRRDVLWSLARISKTRCVPYSLRALSDPDPIVRKMAGETLAGAASPGPDRE